MKAISTMTSLVLAAPTCHPVATRCPLAVKGTASNTLMILGSTEGSTEIAPITATKNGIIVHWAFSGVAVNPLVTTPASVAIIIPSSTDIPMSNGLCGSGAPRTTNPVNTATTWNTPTRRGGTSRPATIPTLGKAVVLRRLSASVCRRAVSVFSATK